MEFRYWLENLDSDEETERVDALNMTNQLPLIKGPIMAGISELTRGFHLNTIVGRMMRPWVNTLNVANWKRGLEPRFKDEDGEPNANFHAAYDLFKDEVGKAVKSLPFKKGKDVRTGSYVDILAPAKSFLGKYEEGSGQYLDNLDNALDISLKVFPKNLQQVMNFINFLQIVRDEFMTFGERLPTLGGGALEQNRAETKKLNEKIDEWEALRKRLYDSL